MFDVNITDPADLYLRGLYDIAANWLADWIIVFLTKGVYNDSFKHVILSAYFQLHIYTYNWHRTT